MTLENGRAGRDGDTGETRSSHARGTPGARQGSLPGTMPKPTYWPAILAFSVCFALWGVLTSYWLSVVGGGGIVLAAARWFGELRHEKNE